LITRFTFTALHFLFAASAFSATPNILIIYVDDLGYGDTAVYGHPIVKTPNIDRLAGEGVRFTQFYAPSALCSPSRAGLLTGRTPYRTGVESWIPDNSDVSLARDEFTIAQLVKSSGYRTAVIGKWHLNGGLNLIDVPQPRDFGFDYQYGLAAWVKNEKAEKTKSGKLYPDNMYRNNKPVGQTKNFSAELITDDAIGWLSNSYDEPFFLLLTYSEVHTPVASPEKYLVQYDQYLTAESRGDPWRYYMDWADRPSRGKGEYYANVSYMDAQIGRVLQSLRESGRLDDTLVIFSSDNGPVTSDPQEAWELNMAGETGGFRGRKRYLFEGGLRVPGIVRWPGTVASGALVDTPVTALDILPTIADYLDLSLPEGRAVDGQSITGLLDEDKATSLKRSSIFYWSIPTPDGMEYAVRDGWWKMILNQDGQPQYLFNLSHDRYEVHNLLKREPGRVNDLRKKFDSYRANVEG